MRKSAYCLLLCISLCVSGIFLSSMSLPSFNIVDKGIVHMSSFSSQWKLDALARIPEAADWQCNKHKALRNFSSHQLTPFPLHFLPARGSMSHASVFLETDWGKCDLISQNSSVEPCRKIGQGHPSMPDAWLEEFMEAVLIQNPSCLKRSDNVESSTANPRNDVPLPSCDAVDVGANTGLVSLRLLQLGVTRLIAIEPQVDLCCAARQSAIYNGYGQRSLFLCGGLAPHDSDPDKISKTLKITDAFWRPVLIPQRVAYLASQPVVRARRHPVTSPHNPAHIVDRRSRRRQEEDHQVLLPVSCTHSLS